MRIRLILREVPFWVIVGLMIVFAVNNGYFAGRVADNDVWPVTYLMLQAVEGSATLFLFIVAGLYAAELIWRERDIRTDGLAINEVLSSLEQSGARQRVLIVDGSRRNPFERRFRSYSHGLAPMESGRPDEIVASVLPPNQVIEDTAGNKIGAFASALLNELDRAPSGHADLVQEAVTRTIELTTATRTESPESPPTVSPDGSELP